MQQDDNVDGEICRASHCYITMYVEDLATYFHFKINDHNVLPAFNTYYEDLSGFCSIYSSCKLLHRSWNYIMISWPRLKQP